MPPMLLMRKGQRLQSDVLLPIGTVGTVTRSVWSVSFSVQLHSMSTYQPPLGAGAGGSRMTAPGSCQPQPHCQLCKL